MPALAFERFLSTPEMMAVFDETSVVQAMLDFEAALAGAQAEEGVIPAAAAASIAACCRAEQFDVPAIIAASGRAGSLAIPLVRALTEAVERTQAEAAGHVHWGSTSQDAIDTGMVLLARRALALIDRDVGRLTSALLAVAAHHGEAPVLARTLLQPASVLSLGFKLVEWIAPLVRSRERLRIAAGQALQLQLGGAVGTLVVMGDKGESVARRVAAALRLRLPEGAWHTQRDELASLACELGVLTGALGKIAKDISLMAQAEVAELAEPSGQGRGGSSAMPHKRNPVASMVALAAALRVPHRVSALLAAMVQEHERGLGNWQAELAETAGLYIGVHGALKALADLGGDIEVDPARMRRNIESLDGLVFAEALAVRLASSIGRANAHGLLERLSQESMKTGRHLRELVQQAVDGDHRLRGQIDAAELAALFDPVLAAQPAIALARPRLESLAQRARELDSSAPWTAWLS